MRPTEEAAKNAMRCRGGSDLLSHHEQSNNKTNYIRKPSGEPELWFAQAANSSPKAADSPRSKTSLGLRTEEAENIKLKIKGTDVNWYKHELNDDIANLKIKNGSNGITIRNLSQESEDWHSHSLCSTDIHSSGMKSPRITTEQAACNASKHRPVGFPNWYKCEENLSKDIEPERPSSRCASTDAQSNFKKNHEDHDWFSHDGKYAPIGSPRSPRRTSPEAMLNADKLTKESENWYDPSSEMNNNHPPTNGHDDLHEKDIEKALIHESLTDYHPPDNLEILSLNSPKSYGRKSYHY